MVVVDVQEAKTRLSELLRMVEAGHDVHIARAGTVIAKLEPVAPKTRDLSKPLLPEIGTIGLSAFLEPLAESELDDWEDSRLDPTAGTTS